MLVLLLLTYGIVLGLAATSWTGGGQEGVGGGHTSSTALLPGPPGGGEGRVGLGEEGCPAVCVCRQEKAYYKAECSAKNLSEVPVGLSANITAM